MNGQNQLDSYNPVVIPVLENSAVRRHVRPIPVDLYHRLCSDGSFQERTELIEGVVFDKMTVSPDHSFYVQTLFELMSPFIPQDTYIRLQQPLTFSSSEPEPDLAVVRGDRGTYRTAHPSGALLIVEVALSSLDYDREKARIYAAAGIPVYWILNGVARILEVRSNPTHQGYTVLQDYTFHETVPLWGSVLDLASLR